MAQTRRPRSGASTLFPVVISADASAEVKKAAIIATIEESGLPPRQAAMSIGIPSSSYYRLLDDDAGLFERLEAATAVYARRMAGVIRKAAARGSYRAAMWWLERRMPESFGPKLNVTVDERTLEDEYADHGEDWIDRQSEALIESVVARMAKPPRARRQSS